MSDVKRSPRRRVPLPSQGRLLEMLTYDDKTGVLLWRNRADVPKEWNTRYAGKIAMTFIGPDGRSRGQIGTRAPVLKSRVIWKIQTGEDADEVSHLNGDLQDFRFTNLKNNSRQYSSRSTTMYADNTSGVRGVSWDQDRNLWKAEITVRGRGVHLGRFSTLDRAAKARQAAEIKYGFAASPLTAPPLP